MTDESQEKQPKTSARRRWLFRGAAVCLGLSFFVVIEVACWVFDLGTPEVVDDPFVGFSEVQPLFELNVDSTRHEVAPSRRKFFAEESFPARKSSNTFRIFVLGGSTVQGRPFSTKTSFTRFLQIGLEAIDPTRNWEVINCGGISYASYRLVPILMECLEYEPDLFVVCTGHNEFLEDRTYGFIRDLPMDPSPAVYAVSWLRSYHLYRGLLKPFAQDPLKNATPSSLGANVDALLDYREGLAAYTRNDEWQEGVIQHFQWNLVRLIQTAQRDNVPIMLMLPPSNLADTPPFKSLPSAHRDKPEDRKKFQDFIAEAKRSWQKDPYKALDFLKNATSFDPHNAAGHYLHGQLLESLGKSAEAKLAYTRARDCDICPLRIVSSMEEEIRNQHHYPWSHYHKVPLFDAAFYLESKTDDGLIDNSWLVDHVHPSIKGHQELAFGLILELHSELNLPWKRRSKDRVFQQFQKHVDALPAQYFLKGEQRLENLRYWTQGMADGPPIWQKKLELKK